MDDLSFVHAELDKLEYKDLPALATECGVAAGTIAKVKCRATRNPRYDTVKAIANYFRAKAAVVT